MMAVNNGAFADSKQLNKQLKMGAARKRESVLVRPLGCCERFFHLYARAFPVHFCLVAQVEGALDSAKLGAALEQVRRRHPALRICIVDDAETGPAFYRIDNPIKLHSAPAETAADWRWVVERELSLPFSTFPGPLMRARSCRHPMALDCPHVSSCDSGRIVRNAHSHDVMRALAAIVSSLTAASLSKR
jgi:hypothetical protein